MYTCIISLYQPFQQFDSYSAAACASNRPTAWGDYMERQLQWQINNFMSKIMKMKIFNVVNRHGD